MARAKKGKIQCEAPRYNLNSTSSNQQKMLSPWKQSTVLKYANMYSPFLWRNAKEQSKGGGGEDRQNYANSAWNPWISSRTSTKICPWATWTVKTWSNIRRMSESSEVVGGGTSTSVAATPDASAASAPVEEGWGGTAPEDTPLRRVEPTLKWAALCLKKVAPIGVTTWTSSPEWKSARPRNNKILWMKIGWIKACPTAELLWTSFKERRNRWGKLIDAPDIKAYKKPHRYRGMVWKWEISHKEWHATLRKR